MIILSNSQKLKQLYAVSFDTATYHDLECFISEHSGYTLTRVDPTAFLQTQTHPGSYINLVVNDVCLRKQITNYLDTNNFDRFSLIHDQSYATSASIAPGCVIYPMVSIYPSAIIQRDVIVHSMTAIAHNCQVGSGAFISGGVTVAGSTFIGDFTQIGIDSTIYDRVTIVADTKIGAGTVVRKDILTPGTYSSQLKNNLVKIK